MKLFELFATLSLDTSGFDQNIKSATRQGQSFASSMQTKLSAGTIAMGNLISSGVEKAGKAVVDLGKKAFTATGELEQNLGGSEAVWGEWADSVQKIAENAAGSLGLSMSDYLAEANKMGSLLKGSGFETEEAFSLATEVMQRASDVASIMGIDIGSAMQAVEGAAKGNFTMMDNLGVAINDTALANYALEKGITKSTRAMSTQEKNLLAFQLFMERTEDYAGNYEKENATLSGSFTSLAAEFDNFLVGRGNVNKFVDAIEGAAKASLRTLGEMVPMLWDRSKQAIETAWPKLKSALTNFWDNDAPTIVTNGANALIDGANAIFNTNIPHIDKIDLPTVEKIKTFVTSWWETGGRSAVEGVCKWTLSIFNVPDETANQVAQTVGGWWDGIRGAVSDVTDWSLKFWGVKEWEESDRQKVVDWWETAAKDIEDAIHFVIHPEVTGAKDYGDYVRNYWFPEFVKSAGELVLPIASTIMSPFKNSVEFWAGLKPGTIDKGQEMLMDTAENLPEKWRELNDGDNARKGFNKLVGVLSGKAEDELQNELDGMELTAKPSAEWDGAAETALQRALLSMGLTAPVHVVPMSGASTDNVFSRANPGFATGLDYVPYDDYMARLHEGEAVLTKAEASDWRKGGDYAPAAAIDYGQMAAAVASALSGMTVQMSGRAVGELVAPTVSAAIARDAYAGRYAR